VKLEENKGTKFTAELISGARVGKRLSTDRPDHVA
jgi:hypothetical protein